MRAIEEPRGHGRAANLAFAAGSVALLGAMGVDFLSVIGRHVGHPFLGSIELVQACVVIAASTALIGGTLAGVHAAVHVIVERLGERQRIGWARFGSALGMLFFLLLAVGGAWLTLDTAAGDERTDLLGLPLTPLRVIWSLASAATAGIFLYRVFKPVPVTRELPLEP